MHLYQKVIYKDEIQKIEVYKKIAAIEVLDDYNGYKEKN